MRGRSEGPAWPGLSASRSLWGVKNIALGLFLALSVSTIATEGAEAQGAEAALHQPGELPVFHGLSYMTAFGPKNYSVVNLLYGIIVISLTVVAIIGVLVLAGCVMRGRRTGARPIGDVPLVHGGQGLYFVYIGIAVSFLTLFASALWNYEVLADVATQPPGDAPTIHVIGHQWWWEFAYSSPDPTRDFTTANEIHIPVGKPVRIELTTADVIHSFWVPALTGKMDTIPGQTNVTWMQADKAGVYRGQCTQFCGQEHALMGLLVIAEPPQKFQAWWDRQLQGPQPPAQEAAATLAGEGQQAFMKNCAVCHSIRGTLAQGKVGPDLSHLMERNSLGAATLPNSIGDLSGWVANPQTIKPGNYMPDLDLSAADLVSIRQYLETLN